MNDSVMITLSCYLRFTDYILSDAQGDSLINPMGCGIGNSYERDFRRDLRNVGGVINRLAGVQGWPMTGVCPSADGWIG